MQVEGSGFKLQPLDLDKLINIPIDLPGDRGVLENKNDHVHRVGVAALMEVQKSNKKKWKRRPGKKNVIPVSSYKMPLGPDHIGKKRQ